MSSARTTNPGRTWISSQPPPFTAQIFKNRDDSQWDNDTSQTVKYDPDRPGGHIFYERTLNTYKKKLKPGIIKAANKTEPGKTPVRFQDEGESGREVVTTYAAGVSFSTTKSYESLIAERDALLETEGAYKRRIQQLEEENTQILLDYDGMYKENNILRDKLDKGEDNHVESYQRIHDDRKVMRETETAYKRRINQLESDTTDMLKNFESLYTENKVLRDKANKLEERLNAIDRLDEVKKMHELEKKVKLLEKTVRTMGYERQCLVKENNEIENQMFKQREEISELTKSNLLLERENEGFKRGFMALGQKVDVGWKDEIKHKTRRQEEEERIFKEEHAAFKKDIDSLNKEVHKLEKINIELKTRNELLEQAKEEADRRLVQLTREQGQRTPSAVKRRDAELDQIKQQRVEEIQQTVEHLKAENIELKTKNDVLGKEKATFEERLRNAVKQPRETASSIRRTMETEREIRDLNMHVDNFKEKVKYLEVENVDLKNELGKLEVETKVQRQTSKALASDKDNQTDGQLKSLNSKLISVNQELQTLTLENVQLKAEYSKREDKMTQQIETVTKEKEGLQRDKGTLESSMQKTNSTATDKITVLQDELNAAQVELRLLQVNFGNIKTSLEEEKTETNKLTNQLEDKRTELDKLKESIRNNRDVYLELSSEQRENASLKRELEDLHANAKTNALKQEAELEELLKNQEFVNSALADHKIRLDMLQQEKQDLKSENLQLVKANERQVKTVADLQVDIRKETEDGSSKTKTLFDELEQVKKDLKKSEKGLIEARLENEITKNERENQVKKLITQMEKLKSEREMETQQLKHQGESLRSEVARLKIFEERIESMETNLQELVHRLKESEERNKHVTNDKLASLQHVVSEMKSENLANRIRAAESEQNELEKHRLEIEIKEDTINEIRKLKEENKRLKSLLEDTRSAEKAKDEWSGKRNKFNEIMAQNKRLQEENKRVLDLFESSHTETMKTDLKSKTEQLTTLEAKFQRYVTVNEMMKKTADETYVEMRKVGLKADMSHRFQQENNKLKAENQKLKDDNLKKDHTVAALKELEVTKAKYIDSTAKNQRLYEENMRLRETIEKSNDYKTAFQKLKNEEKATQEVKSSEESALLKNTFQLKEIELMREVEVHKDRASSLQEKSKRLTEELTKMTLNLSKKDDLIIKLKEQESASMKLKDASTHVNRLYEENQRLRNLLENSSGGWNKNFQNTKVLSAIGFNHQPTIATAMYVQPQASASKQTNLITVSDTYANLHVQTQKRNTLSNRHNNI